MISLVRRTVFRFFVVILFLLFLSGTASALQGDVSISPTSVNTNVGDTFQVDINVDSALLPLGSYLFTINYDASKVNIVSITGGTAAEFSSTPISNPASYTSGSTAFSAVNGTSLISPVAISNVAKINFQAVSDGSIPLNIVISALNDTSGFDILPQTPLGSNVLINPSPPTGVNGIYIVFFSFISLFLGLAGLSVKKKSFHMTLLITLIMILFSSQIVFGFSDFDINADGNDAFTDSDHILEYLIGMSNINRPEWADLDGNSRIDIVDAMLLAQRLNGLLADDQLFYVVDRLVSAERPSGGFIDFFGETSSTPPLSQIQLFNNGNRVTINTFSGPNGEFFCQIPGEFGDEIKVSVLDPINKESLPIYRNFPQDIIRPQPIITNPANLSTIGSGDTIIQAIDVSNDDTVELARFEYFDNGTFQWQPIDSTVTRWPSDAIQPNDYWQVIWDTSTMTEDLYEIRVTTYDTSTSAQDSIFVNLEQSPEASITVTFEPSGNVILDGTGSTDDEFITNYEWDIDDDGVADFFGQNVDWLPSSPTVVNLVNLEVVDNNGVAAKAAVAVKPAVKKVKTDLTFEMFSVLGIRSEIGIVRVDKILLRNAHIYASAPWNLITDAIDLLQEVTNELSAATDEMFIDNPDYDKIKNHLNNAQQKLKQAKRKLGEAKIAGANGAKIDANIAEIDEQIVNIGFLWGTIELAKNLGGDHKYIKEFEVPKRGGTDSSSYTEGAKTIKILLDDTTDTDVQLHELDHYFHYWKNKESIPGPGGKHSLSDKNQDLGLAFSEGWAQFSSCSKRNSKYFRDTIDGKYEQDLEDNTIIGLDDKDRTTGAKKNLPKGGKSEAAVGAILWDLFDSNDDGNDTVSIPFKTMFLALNQKVNGHYPRTIEEYYQALTSLTNGTPSNASIKQVFAKNGVTIP